MFEYFENNYAWNLSVVCSLAMGGEISELDRGLRPLLGSDHAPTERERQAWQGAWLELGRHVKRLSLEDAGRGYVVSAGEKALRAANYLLFAERNMKWSDPERLEVYREMHELFGQGLRQRGDPCERVTVPFEGGTLSGWLHLPPGPGPHPCVLFYNGFDSVKEMNYLLYAEMAARRGLATLFADQEGTGEAVRLQRHAKRHDSEVSATAYVDWLERHPRIDGQRIGIVGMSAGGYDAPRAGTYETRLRCVACLGAFFNIDTHRDRFLGRGQSTLSSGLSDMAEHLIHVTGASSIEQAVDVYGRRDLTTVLPNLRCPLLIVHGEDDRQVPLVHAQRTIAGAVNAASAELKVFTAQEGSSEHCGLDILSMQGQYLFSWLADQLR